MGNMHAYSSVATHPYPRGEPIAPLTPFEGPLTDSLRILESKDTRTPKRKATQHALDVASWRYLEGGKHQGIVCSYRTLDLSRLPMKGGYVHKGSGSLHLRNRTSGEEGYKG